MGYIRDENGNIIRDEAGYPILDEVDEIMVLHGIHQHVASKPSFSFPYLYLVVKQAISQGIGSKPFFNYLFLALTVAKHAFQKNIVKLTGQTVTRIFQYPTYTDIPYANPLTESIEYRTLITQDEIGEEKRRCKWPYPRRNIQLQYNYITKAKAKDIWDFYITKLGSLSTFAFIYPYLNTYENEYVGTGDGSTTEFNLPSYQAASYTLYVDGVEQQAGGVDYTFSSATSTAGRDKVTFVAAPASGERITWSFAGYLALKVRFAEDNLTFETLYDRLVSMGVKLRGLLSDEND